MATFHPIAATSAVHVRYIMHGQNCENILHYKWLNGIPPSSGTLLTLATDTYNTIVQKMALLSHTGVDFKEVYCRNLHTEFADQATYAPVPSTSGVKNANRHTNQSCKSIVKRSGLTGRSRHGGMRLSGFDASEIINDIVAPALVTLIANLITSLIANRGGGNLVPAVGSPTNGVSYTLTSFAVPTVKVGTIDSRTVVV